MADLSSRTVAQLKEELQKKGVDVKGLKLKKDYVEKLQEVLDSDSQNVEIDELAQETQPQDVNGQSDPETSNAEEGKHVSSVKHPQAIQDPEVMPSKDTTSDTQVDNAEDDIMKEAKEDPTIAITKGEKNEMVLGDADGDLDEKMEAAAEAGKEERLEERGEAPQRTHSEQVAAEEKMEEGNVAVEAAEAQPRQVQAEEAEEQSATERQDKDTADQQPVHAEKRKRADDDDEKNGKRARLSPTVEHEDPKAETTKTTTTEPVTEASGNDVSLEQPSAEKEPTHPLPDKLSHVSHPATRALYISNLKRPLLTPDLKAWLIEQGVSDEVKEDGVLDGDAGVNGGVWLDGVKSHCYCIFKTIEIAIAAATRIQNQVFPVDHGAALTVEFIPEDIVPSLVSQEQTAWENGRNKLVLEHSKGTGFGGSDYSFDLVPPKGKDGIRSGGGLGDLRPPPATLNSRPPELTVRPPFNGGVGGPRPEFRPPPPNDGWGSRINRVNEAPGLQRTRTQPPLTYRESPKHASAAPRFERGPRQEREPTGWGSQPRNNGPGNWNRSNDGAWGRPSERRW